MCTIRTGLYKMGGKSTSQRTDQPTDLAINVLASRPTQNYTNNFGKFLVKLSSVNL